MPTATRPVLLTSPVQRTPGFSASFLPGRGRRWKGTFLVTYAAVRNHGLQTVCMAPMFEEVVDQVDACSNVTIV